MKPLATFKHISSKNANYGDAEKYLTFAHDEFTMKPTLDANGRLVPREDYRISTLNCGEENFAVACMRSNLRYGKNQKREDVKSHHYIISFDPRDGPDNGLTVDKAQELGERFCREQFPGHQAIVCTHPDVIRYCESQYPPECFEEEEHYQSLALLFHLTSESHQIGRAHV